MTITEVVHNFQSALNSVLPSMQRVSIGWDRPDAYDNWDSVASALYKTLVTDVLYWGLPESKKACFDLIPYDLQGIDYTKRCFLEVLSSTREQPEILVFNALVTTARPFDTAEVIPLADNLHLSGSSLGYLPLDQAEFQLRFPARSGSLVLKEIHLPSSLELGAAETYEEA